MSNRKILKLAKETGRRPRENDARLLMTKDLAPEVIFEQMGISIPLNMLDQFYEELAEELDSLTLFDDVAPVLEVLTAAGFKLAFCSNLAKPYGAAIDKLLTHYEFAKCLSYEIGAIKPELEIYDAIVNKTGASPSEILFVGDTFHADYEGPTHYGFSALHLQRDPGEPSLLSIRSLNQIMDYAL